MSLRFAGSSSSTSSFKHKLIIAAVICSSMLAVGITRANPTKEIKVKVPVERIVIKHDTKVKVKTVEIYKSRPTGYITSDQCISIKPGTKFPEIMFLYGWPANDDGDSYSGMFDYPIRGRAEDLCRIDFVDMKVTTATLDRGSY